MKRIIAVYGHSNCGKTLNHVRELIRSNGGVSLSSNPPHKEFAKVVFNTI